MFDIFAKLLSSIASFLFPLFASYKALKTSDPAQLTPWLMYWVVLACALLVESWTEWFLCWIPFYAYIRLLFLLYLILPQTQGARVIYTTYIHPWLAENEGAIEDFIASAHERLKQAGIAYIKRAIELLKTNVLGLPPSPEAASAGPGQPPAQSYTQSLLARFSLPATRWSGGGQGEPGAASGADFYSFLASAVSAAANAAAASSSASRGAPAAPGEGETLIPANIRGTSARMSFIAAQRERLNYVLSALEREASQLQSESEVGSGNASLDPQAGFGGTTKTRSMSGHSAGSFETGASGLSKSRSEADFEKLEAENWSGAEEDINREGLRRRGGNQGGWMPWAWGGGGNTGTSAGSGGERSGSTPTQE
ncbi:HVA22 family TB2/DP1 protein [Naviculisporaceae sp. PSN 640]